MSAYIVPPETIHILAAWASIRLSPVGVPMVQQSEAIAAAKILFAENARSVAHRYREDRAEMSSEYTKADWQRIVTDYKAELAFGAARGYEYQACECGDFRSTEAAEIVHRAISNAGKQICDAAGVHGWTIGEAEMERAQR